LRGINVGGNKRVPMAELREVLQSLGFTDVRTLLQSGNAVFTSPRKDVDALASEISAGIRERFGFDVSVVLFTGEEIARVVEGNPMPGALEMPKNLHVYFLDSRPDPARMTVFDPAVLAPEQVVAGERVIYIWHREGLLASKVTPAMWKRFGGVVTARNWNTVVKLLELTGP
jgi:uncharacterized protein (DUF1697 family)